jgi:DNA-directed RNA polymerase specialized sigma24 family protein
MVGMARHKLKGTPRQMADEEDVALSAFNSFCLGAEKGNFTQLTDRSNLWPLLVSITAHKAVDLIRYQNRLKRGGPGDGTEPTENEESASSDSTQNRIPRGSIEFQEIISEEPTPEFAAQVADEFDRLITRLDDESLQSVALWKLEGFTNDEIAEKLDCVPRTVERKLQLIRTLWQRDSDN